MHRFARKWTQRVLFAAVIAAMAAPAVAQKTGCDYCERGMVADVEFLTPQKNVLTVNPDGTGETLAGIGITFRVRIQCSLYGPAPAPLTPLAGLQGEDIQLFSPSLCYCIPLHAARPTDAEGWTEFTGTLMGGGCTDRVWIYVGGILLAEVPLRINSPDTGIASPCAADASDLAAFAIRLGAPERYEYCFDYDGDGAIDASDLALFASVLGQVASCR